MKHEEDLINEAIEEWRIKMGKGVMYLPKNYNPYLIASLVLYKYYKNNPNNSCLIIVSTFSERQQFIEKLTSSDNDEFNAKIKSMLESNNLKVFTESYVNSQQYVIFNTLVIAINISDLTTNVRECLSKSLYKLVLLNNVLPTQQTATLHTIVPGLDVFKPTEVLLARGNTPVEEMRIGVDITDDEILKELETREQYIRTSLNIFGNLSLMQEAFMGNSTMNFSAQDVCERIASENGWNEHLDMSIEMNRSIDKLYNPNALRERASITYTIIRERNQLISDYDGKLNEIFNIIKERPNERFIIISKRSEFATKITEYLNMQSSDVICASVHNKLDQIPMLDEKGNQVFVKSGISKGKPKMLGAQAQCTKNLQLFRNGDIQAISTNSSPDKDLEISVTSVIITSPSCLTLEEYLYRLPNLFITSPILKLYTIYCNNTIEEKKVLSQISKNHTIIEKNEKKVIFDESCGVIIC